MTSPSRLTRTRSSLPLFASLMTLLVVACGPVAIGLSIPSGGSSGSTPPLALAATMLAPGANSGPCNLVTGLDLLVNRPNVTLTYSLNGGAERAFTNPQTELVEPELQANVSQQRFVLLRAGSNTLVLRASVGAEQVQQTLSIDIAVDPTVVDLEPPDVRGQDMVLNWSLPTGNETFFRIYFDDEVATIDALTGTAGTATSPLLVPVSQLNATVVGNRTRYSFTVASLANSPDGLMQHHFFAVRANNGCESRVVTAHTRPAAQQLLWPTRIAYDLTTPAGQNIKAPVGGRASSESVVGMPPLFVDRGADNSSPVIGPVDGIEDMVVAARNQLLFCAGNDGGILTPPIVVDDTKFTSPPCFLPFTQTGAMIKTFAFDNDGDLRPDMFVLTQKRIWVYAGDDVEEALTQNPTPGLNRLLNWKKQCDSFVDLATIPNLPAGVQFLDAFYGDFDGEGTPDLVASIGRPQTTTQAGQTDRILVFYGAGNSDGFVLWNWVSTPPDEIPVGTQFGDDGYFVVGDIDQDGRDDLVTMRHSGVASATLRLWLMRGRGAQPALIESGTIDPRCETARWDQTATVDLDHDGILDVTSLRSINIGVGNIVRIMGYRTDPAAGLLDTGNPYLASDLDRTHDTILPTTPRQRGHMQIRDVDGDGISEVLLRSILSGQEYLTSRVSVYGGVRDATTGLQNWSFVNAAPTQVDFLLAANETPHVHFATADLDFDGVDDLCAIHERTLPPHAAVVMYGNPDWAYERFASVPTDRSYPLAGTLLTGGGATTAQPGKVDRIGDLILDVDATLGVSVLPAANDAGVNNGAFRSARRLALQSPLPAPVMHFEVPFVPKAVSDLLVLCTDGSIGTLEFDRAAGSYGFRNETTIPGAVEMHAAKFDNDRRTDCVVIDNNAMMHLVSTVDAAGNRNQDLAIRDSQQLPRQPEMVLVDIINFSVFSEVIVVLAPESGSEVRDVQIWRVVRDNITGEARFFDDPFATSFPQRLASLVAGNFTGRHRNNLHTSKSLVGGTTDGRILIARNGDPTADLLAQDIGTGDVQLLVVDVTNDFLPDLIAYGRGSNELAIFRDKPGPEVPGRFPSANAYQFQGTGSFDKVLVPLPESLTSVAAGLVDNDPYYDLILLSQDGERVHILTTKGAQQKL